MSKVSEFYNRSEEREAYKAYYELMYHLYMNWDAMLAMEPRVVAESRPLAYKVAVTQELSRKVGISDEMLHSIQKYAIADAIIQVSKDGGSYRARYLIVSPGSMPGKYDLLTGEGRAPDQLLPAFTADEPIDLQEQHLYLFIYRSPTIRFEEAYQIAWSLIQDGNL